MEEWRKQQHHPNFFFIMISFRCLFLLFSLFTLAAFMFHSVIVSSQPTLQLQFTVLLSQLVPCWPLYLASQEQSWSALLSCISFGIKNMYNEGKKWVVRRKMMLSRSWILMKIETMSSTRSFLDCWVIPFVSCSWQVEGRESLPSWFPQKKRKTVSLNQRTDTSALRFLSSSSPYFKDLDEHASSLCNPFFVSSHHCLFNFAASCISFFIGVHSPISCMFDCFWIWLFVL